MAATTTQKTPWLIAKLSKDFAQFNFEQSDICAWSPSVNTVFYQDDSPDQTLHELSHALLGHANFRRDIELIGIERDAWHYAKNNLAPLYDINISTDAIEDAMDTYRQWLHSRSTCPRCKATGVQTQANTYHCLSCLTNWHVNDARACGLKRTKI